MTHTTEDGFTLRVVPTMYLDWGLEIFGPDGEELFYSPSCLSAESYGFDFDEDDPDAEGVEWSDERWEEALASEAGDLLDAFGPEDA